MADNPSISNGMVFIVKRFGLEEQQHLVRYRKKQRLSITGIKQLDLATIACMTELKELALYRSTVKDYAPLQQFPQLRELLVNGGSSSDQFESIGGLTQIEKLSLHYLPQLERLPDFSQSTSLRAVRLWQCKRLADIQALATAPALEEVEIIDTPHAPAQLEFLMRLPTVRYVSGQFGSKKQNSEFTAMLERYGKQQFWNSPS